MTGRDLFGNPVPSETPKRTPGSKRPPGQFGRARRFTRADHIMAGNMTPKRSAAQTRRSLNSARATLERLAVPWAEIDNSVQGVGSGRGQDRTFRPSTCSLLY